MDDQEPKWPYWAALLLCIAAGLWFARDYITPLVSRLSGEQTAVVDAPAPANKASGPRYPLPPTPDPLAAGPNETAGPADPLPTLAESDTFFKDILTQVFGPDIDTLLATDGLVTRFVASIDSLPARQIPRRMWPVTAQLEAFTVSAGPNEGQFYLSPENYARYKALVDLATTADPAVAAELYQTTYPLLQEAYGGLGYPEGYFNDRVVAVIDHLLTTPVPSEPIVLVRPHVLYEYALPELEALSGGQKLLIRMGPANGEKVRQQLREIRGLIASN